MFCEVSMSGREVPRRRSDEEFGKGKEWEKDAEITCSESKTVKVLSVDFR